MSWTTFANWLGEYWLIQLGTESERYEEYEPSKTITTFAIDMKLGSG